MKFSYFILGILALYISFNNVPIFDYPRDSNVTPYSPLVHAGAVDFGFDNLPFTLHYSAYLTHRYSSYLALLALSLSLLFFYLKDKQFKVAQAPAFSSFLCGIVLFSDQNVITNLVDVPLIRLLPGFSYLALPMFFPLFLAFILLGVFRFKEKVGKSALVLALTVLVILAPKLPQPEVLALEKNKLKELVDTKQVDQNLTPSSFLLKEYQGLKISGNPAQYKEINVSDKCRPSASIHSQESSKALDNNPKTRWSSKGPQKTGDYFELICNEEIVFDKMALILGASKTDFPRGISVEINKSKILNLQDWLGPIRETKKGLYYFGAQEEVELTFQATQKFKEIKLTIERGDNTFDWSIAEIKFYRDASSTHPTE